LSSSFFIPPCGTLASADLGGDNHREDRTSANPEDSLLMSALAFYTSDSPIYAADFQALLRCYDERPGAIPLLDEVVASYGPDAVVVDWGSGSGDLTRWLLARFRTVHAVEPNATLREVLMRSCPQARVIAGTIADADVPMAIDLGFIRHVLYHVPDHKWPAYILRCAARLSPGGVLVVILKHPDTACNAMLEAFGTRRFDLTSINADLRRHPEFRVETVAVPGTVATTSVEDTVAIARFMLNDRSPDSYPRPIREDEVRAYVRGHFWDEEHGRGGWRCDALYYLVRRNRYWR